VNPQQKEAGGAGRCLAAGKESEASRQNRNALPTSVDYLHGPGARVQWLKKKKENPQSHSIKEQARLNACQGQKDPGSLSLH
jgi:hypothetical protein